MTVLYRAYLDANMWMGFGYSMDGAPQVPTGPESSKIMSALFEGRLHREPRRAMLRMHGLNVTELELPYLCPLLS